MCFYVDRFSINSNFSPQNSKITYFKFYDKIMKKNKMKKLRTL